MEDTQIHPYHSDLLCVGDYPKFYDLITTQGEDLMIRKETMPPGLDSFIRDYAVNYDKFQRMNDSYFLDEDNRISVRRGHKWWKKWALCFGLVLMLCPAFIG